MKNIKLTFADFMHEIEEEAEKEGPEATKQLNDFKEYYKRVRKRWEKKNESKTS